MRNNPQAQIESENGGMPEISFVAVGIRGRMTLVCGNLSAARTILDAFEQHAKAQGAVQLLPNLSALRCRIALLERLRYYAEAFHRTYIRMEVGVLSAMAKYRLGMAWKEEFLDTLRQASGYGFLRLISEEGAVNGYADNTLKPKGLATRTHAAQMMMNLCKVK